MKVYRGTPAPYGVGPGKVVVVKADGTRYELEHIVRHSLDGFAWGYTGFAPADLARCLLWDHLGHEPHKLLYEEFKFDMLASLVGHRTFAISESTIEDWLELNKFLPREAA